MSRAAVRRLHRHERHICRACRNHPARFRYRGEIRADRDHTLCFRCYRAEVNRARARRLSEITTPRPLKMTLAQAVERAPTRAIGAFNGPAERVESNSRRLSRLHRGFTHSEEGTSGNISRPA
jgi:hypothetical protein